MEQRSRRAGCVRPLESTTPPSADDPAANEVGERGTRVDPVPLGDDDNRRWYRHPPPASRWHPPHRQGGRPRPSTRDASQRAPNPRRRCRTRRRRWNGRTTRSRPVGPRRTPVLHPTEIDSAAMRGAAVVEWGRVPGIEAPIPVARGCHGWRGHLTPGTVLRARRRQLGFRFRSPGDFDASGGLGPVAEGETQAPGSVFVMLALSPLLLPGTIAESVSRKARCFPRWFRHHIT